MRLIDINKIHLDDGWNEEHKKFTSYSEAMIDETEIVEAIPIEWIDGYIKRRANDVNIYAEILFISDMVKEWEKENEHKESD